jgi:hypothetical protein
VEVAVVIYLVEVVAVIYQEVAGVAVTCLEEVEAFAID